MTKNTSATDFTFRLNTERDALKSLVTLLETEQQSLIDGHTEQLQDLADKKTQAVQELSKLANDRKNVLLAHDMEIKSKGILVWLQAYAPASLPTWQEIQQLAERMQYLNRTNGTLIQTKLRHNQQTMTALLNAANSTHGLLYGADGQPHHHSPGRILGSV
jgi:flagella synthesis protein FlgN